MDEDAWRALEPGTAHPLQRLRAVRLLMDAGVRTGVLMAPIVPGLTSHPAKLERTLKAIADHGAAFVGSNLLHLKDGTRAHFLRFLAPEFPRLLPRYERLYAGAYAPKAYRAEVQAVLDVLQGRYGLTGRPPGDGPRNGAPMEPANQPAQAVFEWGDPGPRVGRKPAR